MATISILFFNQLHIEPKTTYVLEFMNKVNLVGIIGSNKITKSFIWVTKLNHQFG